MATCDVCGGPMRPLFTGSFCPKDCDSRAAKAQSEPWELEVVLDAVLWRFKRFDVSREKVPLVATHGIWACGSWDMGTPLQEVNRHLRISWRFRAYPNEFRVDDDGITAIGYFKMPGKAPLAAFWRVEP